MNIDVMCTQVLALLIMIVIMCHVLRPQLSISRGNAPYDGR